MDGLPGVAVIEVAAQHRGQGVRAGVTPGLEPGHHLDLPGGSGPAGPATPLDHLEVLEAGKASARRIGVLLREVIGRL